jgi:hypothetical protein
MDVLQPELVALLKQAGDVLFSETVKEHMASILVPYFSAKYDFFQWTYSDETKAKVAKKSEKEKKEQFLLMLGAGLISAYFLSPLWGAMLGVFSFAAALPEFTKRAVSGLIGSQLMRIRQIVIDKKLKDFQNGTGTQ